VKQIIAPVAALVFAIVRAFLAGALAEPGTGFMPRGAGLFVLTLLAAAAVAGWQWSRGIPASCRLGGGQEGGEEEPAGTGRADTLGVLSILLAAAGLLAGAALAFVWRGRLWLPVVVSAVVSAICLTLLIPAASGRRLRDKAAMEGLLLLPLSVYGMFALLYAYLAGKNLIYVQENTLTLLCCAALLMAIYADSRCRVGFEPVRRTVFWLTAAAFLCTAASLPMTLLRLTTSVVSTTSAPGLDLVNAGFALYLWRRAAALQEFGIRLKRERRKQAPTDAGE
jgi:hypothetical protein